METILGSSIIGGNVVIGNYDNSIGTNVRKCRANLLYNYAVASNYDVSGDTPYSMCDND